MECSLFIKKDMHCFVKGCRNNSIRTKQPGVSFHTIPKRLKSQWLTVIGRDPNIFIIQQRICSEHFDDDDFEKFGFHKRLKADVIPTLHLPVDLSESEETVNPMSPIDMPVENVTEAEQPEIITIELERSSPDSSYEEIYASNFPVEEIKEPVPSTPLLIMSGSDVVDSDEESISVSSMSADDEPEVKENLTGRRVSDSSNLPLPENTNFPPGTSSDNSSVESSYINPLHYLKRLKQEQERAKLFKNKYKSARRTGNRRKKKILYLKTVLDDLKKKIKQSTDASKPD